MRIHVIIRAAGDRLRAEVPEIPGLFAEGTSSLALLEVIHNTAGQRLGNGAIVQIGEVIFPGDFQQSDVERARGASERGECQELSTALAEIAGMSLEDWRKKVQARAQR